MGCATGCDRKKNFCYQPPAERHKTQNRFGGLVWEGRKGRTAHKIMTFSTVTKLPSQSSVSFHVDDTLVVVKIVSVTILAPFLAVCYVFFSAFCCSCNHSKPFQSTKQDAETGSETKKENITTHLATGTARSRGQHVAYYITISETLLPLLGRTNVRLRSCASMRKFFDKFSGFDFREEGNRSFFSSLLYDDSRESLWPSRAQ